MARIKATIVLPLVAVCAMLGCKTFQPRPPSEESFAVFVRNFFADPAFQRQRVIFPLPVVTASPLGESQVLMPRSEWRQIYTIPSDTIIEGIKYKRHIKRNGNACIQRVYIPNSGFQHLCTFHLQNQQWYLSKMEEYNY